MRRSRVVAMLAAVLCMLLLGLAGASRMGVFGDADSRDAIAAQGPLEDALRFRGRALMEYKAPSYRWPYKQRYDPRTGKHYQGGFVNPFDSSANGSLSDQNSASYKYLVSTAALGLPFFALMIIFFIFYLIFGLVRFICCCCGKGCCPRPKEGGYSETHRWVVRGILTALTVAIMIGAILVYVSAGDIPKSVGNDYHGVKGLVGVTVDDTDAMLTMVDDMINLVDSTGTSMKSVVDSLDTSLKARGVPVTFNSKDVDSVIDSAISAVDNFQSNVDSLKTKINNAVKDVDNYMSKINTYIIIAAAVFGGFSIILLLFALWGIKAIVVIGFILTPVFVVISLLLAGVGIILATFLTDICFELQKMIDVFDTQGAKEASQTPIASGMLPCLSDSQVDEVLQPTLQFGNTAVYIHQFAQISDKALAYKNKTTSAPTAADRGSLCFRYDTSCTVVNETSQPSYNEQCVATCSETTQDAVAGPSSSSSSSSSSGVFPTAKSTIETIALANGDASYKYNLTVPFVTSSNTTPGPKYVSVPSTVSSSDISTYQTNLDAFNSGLPWQDTKDTSSYDSFKTVGKNALDLMPNVETLIGDKSNNVEFFGRCRFIYRIGKDVVDKNCHKMDQAFGFFFEGFAVMGIAYAVASIFYIVAIQRLPKSAMATRGKMIEEGDDDDKKGRAWEA